MKTAKYFSRIILLLTFCIFCYSCIGPVPVDVVIIDNELFFMLEEEHEISSLSVIISAAGKKMGTDKHMWILGHDLTTDVEKRKYPKLKQIKYGQKFEEFPVAEGPVPLQRNVEYSVIINMGSKFASERFIITDDNKAIMPKPRFAHQKGRIYSVSVNKDGSKTLILEPVSK